MAQRWNLFLQGTHVLARIRGCHGTGLGTRGPIFALNNSFNSSSKTRTNEGHSSASLYFTSNLNEGVELDAKRGTTLRKLFDEKPWLCFDNYQSTKGNHEFSKFSKDIFSKLLTISHQQGVAKSLYFQFDPRSIVVKHLDNVVYDVAVPVSQLQAADPEAKSVYKDKIVGPFAAMLLSLCLEQAAIDPKTGGRKKEDGYKEVYDLLFRAKTEIWWTSLRQLLSHPLFWTLEQKITFLSCMYIWMTPSKPGNHPHGVEGIHKPKRVQDRSILDFRRAFSRNTLFKHDYNFTIENNGEINVSKSVNVASWKRVFIDEKCFDKDFKFGSGTDMHEFYDLVSLCRHIIFHVEDNNFAAYLVTLERPTTKVAIIHLDRKFSLSLSTFHALRKMKNLDVTNIIDVSPTEPVED